MSFLRAAGWQGRRGRPVEQAQEPAQASSSRREQHEIQAASHDPMQKGLLRDAQLARMQQHADVDALLAKVSNPIFQGA